MLLRPHATIRTNSNGGILDFNFMSEAEVESSWENMTDTAKVVIPKNITFFNEKQITATPASLFKRGQRVLFNLGYYPSSRQVFNGYISDIENKAPFTFFLQDAMWLLKQETIKIEVANQINRTKNISLKQLLTLILPDKFKHTVVSVPQEHYGFYAIDTNLGDWVILRNETVMDVLNKLRSEFTLFSWFRNGRLYVGLASYPQDPATKVNSPIIDFNFEENIIEDNLVYKLADDVKIRLVIKHIRSTVDTDLIKAGKQTQLVYGDQEGDTVEQYFFNVDEADLRLAAERRIEELKYEGFRGEFTTFGEPYVRQGDLVRLKSTKMPERDGIYLVKSVTHNYSVEGYRQTIGIGVRIDNPNLVDNHYAFLL